MRNRVPGAFAIVASFVALLVPFGTPVAGQTFQGRVLDDRDERPVPTALVRLVDGTGEEQAVSIADSTGFYRLVAPAPGIFRLEAARLGFDNFETPLLEASLPDGTYPIDLLLRAHPVALPGFTVETNRVPIEVVERRIRLMVGLAPASLRYRPILFEDIQGHVEKGRGLEGLLRWSNLAGVSISQTTEGPCFSIRRRGCLPVYLNGLNVAGDFVNGVPLDMLEAIMVITSTDGSMVYPGGAVLLYTEAWIR